MESMKCVCFALVCLGVLNGLIECNPFSPLEFVPGKVLTKPEDIIHERVLVKPPPQSDAEQPDGDKFPDDILEIPREIWTKLGEVVFGLIPSEKGTPKELLAGVEGLEEHLESVQRFKNLQDAVGLVEGVSSKIPLGENIPIEVSKLSSNIPQMEEVIGEARKVIKDEDKVKSDVKIEGEVRKDEETSSRKRRHTPDDEEEIKTVAVNTKPIVEARYAIDSPPHETGHFVHGKNGVVMSDPNALEGGRPYIIYINSCKKISIDTENDEEAD